MSEASPGPPPLSLFFSPTSSSLLSVAAPAHSPTRRRATSVPAQREADTAPLSASPGPSPSASPATTASPGTVAATTDSSQADAGLSQPATPLATLSYHLPPEHVPTLLDVSSTATARASPSPPPPPPPRRSADSPARPHTSLYPRTPPPSQPSAGAVRLLLPSAAATPFAALFTAPLQYTAAAQAAYHQRRLYGRQRHGVVQGELLQLYLVVPHSQHALFPWLFAAAAPPPPPSAATPLPSPPVLASEVRPCEFHVDVRLRGATVRADDGRDESDASPSPASTQSTAASPRAAAVPQPPTSLSLSSAGSVASPSEPANATSGWSRFTTRFGRKSGPASDKDAPPSTSGAASTLSLATSPASLAPVTTAASQVAPSPPSAAASSAASPVQTAPPLLSPQSAPVAAVDGASIARPEPRRTRSLGLMSPVHIPPHIVVASHSAFQHEPLGQSLANRSTSLTCSPALHHADTATDPGNCYRFTLTNGDVVLVLETVIHASMDGHMWLEIEVQSPTPHQSLLTSLSPPAVPESAASTASTSVPVPSMAASLRSFMSDHRVLRLPPPQPLAGTLLHVSHAVQVRASVQLVADRVLAEVCVRAVADVSVESVELLTASTRWVQGTSGVGRGSGGSGVPVSVATVFSQSMLPVALPLSLRASEEYHFLFVLEPSVSMSHSLAQLRLDISDGVDASELSEEANVGHLSTGCAVQWRWENASTAITSQHDVSWQLPIHVRPADACDQEDSDPLIAHVPPPEVAMTHPPQIHLHTLFSITVTMRNTSRTSLTCTLQLPSDDADSAAVPATDNRQSAHTHTSSALASGQATPATLLSPINGAPAYPPQAAVPFSPISGFHFPFHSLASRMPQPPATHKLSKQELKGYANSSQQAATAAVSAEVAGVVADEDLTMPHGLVCLDGEVDVGVLAAGACRSIGVQCVAVRCGFVRLPRLVLRVKELHASYVCRNDGVLLAETAT